VPKDVIAEERAAAGAAQAVRMEGSK